MKILASWKNLFSRSISETREFHELVSKVEACQARIKQLEGELFELPPLPALRFLPAPIGDALVRSEAEVEDFLQGEELISGDERDYLLMQMFFRGGVAQINSEISDVIESLEVEDSIRALPIWDVGCGRGELLEIFKTNGYSPVGVETSELMVSKLRKAGFDVRHGDALSELEQAEDNSLGGVAAFHVIEHVEAGYLKSMLELIYRKVSPGGFILVETPNPYCFEALSFFYSDDTHVRPIQPHQLAFTVERAGFRETRAHFSAPISVNRRTAMENWMRHYQNHGLVAWKPQS